MLQTLLGTYFNTLETNFIFVDVFLHQNPPLKAILLAILNIEGIENNFS